MRRRPFVAIAVTLFLLALTASQFAAADQNDQVTPAAPATPQHPVAKAALPSITIEASRERQAVRRRVDKFVASVILRLFAGRMTPPPGLTPWHQALLYSLYRTRQANKQQMQDMESTMVSRIAP